MRIRINKNTYNDNKNSNNNNNNKYNNNNNSNSKIIVINITTTTETRFFWEKTCSLAICLVGNTIICLVALRSKYLQPFMQMWRCKYNFSNLIDMCTSTREKS